MTWSSPAPGTAPPIRSTEPHATLLGIDLDDAFDWSQVVVVTAADIPGDNVVSLIRDDQPILVPVGGEIRHQAEALCLIAAADARRCAPRSSTSASGPSALPAVFDPLDSTEEFAHLEVGAATSRPASREAELVIEGDLPGRAPGAALHREPGDDRRPPARWRRHGARLAASARTTSTAR